MEAQLANNLEVRQHEPQAPHADVVFDSISPARPTDTPSTDTPSTDTLSHSSASSSPIRLRPIAPAPVAAPGAGHPISTASALPPTSTQVRLTTPQHRAWKVESGRLVIDHAAENIRNVLQDGMELSGDMTFTVGGIAFGGRHRDGVIRVSDGTLIVLDGAVIEGEIDAVNVYNLGTIASSSVRARGLLVNWGTLKGGTIGYGAFENYGDLEGTLTKINS
jgi:cytoskeletal protein CcmA (bactofilin family)